MNILDDLFHHAALKSYYEVMMETNQYPPDSETVRKRAYEYYESENNGRPDKKIPPETKIKALKLYKQGVEPEHLSDRLGVKIATLKSWIKNDVSEISAR